MSKSVWLVAGLALAASPASGAVYYGNYTPSQNDVVIASVNDPWIYELRDHDAAATATTQSDFESAFAIINVFNTAFSTSVVFQEFVPDASFTASHISLAMSRTTVATDTLMGVRLERWDAANSIWTTQSTVFDGARLRVAGVPQTGEMFDVSLPFGNNATGSPGGFSSVPAEIIAGERYRIILGGIAGGQGGVNWHYSNVAASTDAIGLDGDASTGPGNSAYWDAFNANQNVPIDGEGDFEFAFAFTDGNPVPSPLTAAPLVAAGVVLRRRR